jgi:hypothetical protein
VPPPTQGSQPSILSQCLTLCPHGFASSSRTSGCLPLIGRCTGCPVRNPFHLSFDSCLCLPQRTHFASIQPIARHAFILTVSRQTIYFSSTDSPHQPLPLRHRSHCHTSATPQNRTRSPFHRPPPSKTSRSSPMTHRHTRQHTLSAFASPLLCTGCNRATLAAVADRL